MVTGIHTTALPCYSVALGPGELAPPGSLLVQNPGAQPSPTETESAFWQGPQVVSVHIQGWEALGQTPSTFSNLFADLIAAWASLWDSYLSKPLAKVRFRADASGTRNNGPDLGNRLLCVKQVILCFQSLYHSQQVALNSHTGLLLVQPDKYM